MLSALADRTIARPKRTLLLVVLFVVVAGVVGGPVAGSLQTDGGFAATESGSARADRADRGGDRRAGSRRAWSPCCATPDAVAGAADVRAALAQQPGIVSVSETPTASRDGRSAYLVATLSRDADEDAVVTGLERALRAAPATSSSAARCSRRARSATASPRTSAAPRCSPSPSCSCCRCSSSAAAPTILPLAVGITTILGTFLALTAVNQVYSLSIFALNLVIGLGLGLAIDYTLFLVTRYREELARQGEGAGAVRTTMSTAGRTVAFSAVTVACAMITLTVFPLGFLKSMGIAGAVVALLAGARRARDRAGDVRALGQQARGPPRAAARARTSRARGTGSPTP